MPQVGIRSNEALKIARVVVVAQPTQRSAPPQLHDHSGHLASSILARPLSRVAPTNPLPALVSSSPKPRLLACHAALRCHPSLSAPPHQSCRHSSAPRNIALPFLPATRRTGWDARRLCIAHALDTITHQHYEHTSTTLMSIQLIVLLAISNRTHHTPTAPSHVSGILLAQTRNLLSIILSRKLSIFLLTTTPTPRRRLTAHPVRRGGGGTIVPTSAFATHTTPPKQPLPHPIQYAPSNNPSHIHTHPFIFITSVVLHPIPATH